MPSRNCFLAGSDQAARFEAKIGDKNQTQDEAEA